MIRQSRDIVVLGGSAGSIPAVTALLSALPDDFPAAVLIVLHRDPEPERLEGLTRLFASRARLTTVSAGDGQRIEAGHVYVGPPDHHMVVANNLIRLERGPRENRSRPSIDVLFKSAALTYGRRVAGILLSGNAARDGPAGLWQVKHRGGVTIVQDPADAQFPGLPQGAIDSVTTDYVLPVREIGPKLIELTSPSRSGDTEKNVPRILIVENESVVATNLQQSLSEMGYDVVDWVPSGEAAMELAQREHPDLILMDIHLAGALTGIESARRIWDTLQIPIVYCTALADLETLRAVQTTDSYGYIVKPFQSGAIRAAIELALARREKELR